MIEGRIQSLLQTRVRIPALLHSTFLSDGVMCVYLWIFNAKFLATVYDLKFLFATLWSDLDRNDGRDAKLWGEKNETKDELCEGTTKR